MAAINTIQLRRGTEASWTSVNPVLAAGEPALSTDVGRIKIGDGSTLWSSLSYMDVTGTGSTNHIAFWNSSSTLSFDSNQLYWDSANNRLGIGTSSPSTALSVSGTTTLDGNLNFATTTNRISWDNGTEYLGRLGDSIIIGTQGTNRILVNSTGNVGIGTDSPGSKLDVRGSAVFNEDGSDADFRIEGDTDANLLFVDASTDSVGIGTSSPGSLLTISSFNAAGTIAGASQTQIFQVNDASSADYVNLGHFNVESNVSRGSFMLSNNGTNGAWEDNVIQFFVHGSQYLYGYYGGNSTDAGCAIMVTQGSDITKLQIGNYDVAPIEFFTSNIFRMIIDSDGNVGIGTTIPSGKLDVNGNVNIDGNLTFDSFTESVVANGNSGTSKTLSLASGTVHTCTLTGNCTFTMPTATAGKSFSLFLNSGVGNYTATFTGVRWADSATPTATITASKVDIYSFISDGTYWYGSFSQNYG